MYSRNRILDIYVPDPCVQFLKPYLKSAQNLNDCAEDSTPEKYAIHGVKNGASISFANNLYVAQVIECDHTVPSVGYLFYERRSKLKEEYKNMEGKELAKLKKQNVQVSQEVLVPLFAFLGDTLPTVFEKYPVLFTFPHIITECTFLHGEQAESKGHTHWSGLKPIVEQHPEVNFVLIHWSCSHKNEEIVEFFKKEGLKNVIPFGCTPQENKV